MILFNLAWAQCNYFVQLFTAQDLHIDRSRKLECLDADQTSQGHLLVGPMKQNNGNRYFSSFHSDHGSELALPLGESIRPNLNYQLVRQSAVRLEVNWQ